MRGWRSIVEALPVGVIVAEPGGRVLYINPEAKRILCGSGQEPEEQVVKSLISSSAVEARVRSSRRGCNEVYWFQVTLGEAGSIEIGMLRLSQAKGSLLLLVLNRRNAYQTFGNLSPEDIEVILNSSPDEIFVTDGEGYTLWVNAACEQLYGMKAEELIGKHVSELEREGIFSPSVTPYVLEKKDKVSLIQNTKSGRKIALTANPVFDKCGNIVRIVTNSRDITELMDLHRELAEARDAVQRLHTDEGTFGQSAFVFKSKSMQALMHTVDRVAPRDVTILLLGESGTGKDAVARIIHERSKRARGPFIKVNCAAIPESLLESELFGYDPGAFTGARRQGKPGLFELAHTGTIFLNEISEIPANLQVKLLQVIQDRQIVRVGGTKVIDLDVRIITASNKDLKQLVERGVFREDLFFRINVVPLYLPPLRERREDIPELIQFYLARFNAKYGLQKRVTGELVNMLMQYPWPGNVRELQNLIERLVVVSEGEYITPNCLPHEILQKVTGAEDTGVPRAVPGESHLKEALASLEKEVLLAAYQKYKSTHKVARVLGVSQPTVVRKLRKYGVQRDK